jgi:hypothetical protein
MFIVGKLNDQKSKVLLFTKGIDIKETWIFNNQQDATECAENLTKGVGGEWTVFELDPITTTKMITVPHKE